VFINRPFLSLWCVIRTQDELYAVIKQDFPKIILKQSFGAASPWPSRRGFVLVLDCLKLLDTTRQQRIIRPGF